MAESQRRSLVPEDLYAFVTVSDPQITPEGDAVAFVRTHIDQEKKESRSAIWLVPTEGGAPFPFTQGTGSDDSPAWSSDGQKLAFVSDRSGDRQIWVINRFGGEAWKATTMCFGAESPVWSPDGKRIAFLSRVGPEDARDLLTQPKTEADKKAEENQAKNESRTFTRMGYRSDSSGILSPRKAQVWVLNLPEPGQPLTKPVQVTWGDYDHTGPHWSPDGKLLAFNASRTDGETLRYHDLFVTPVPEVEDESAFQPLCLTGTRGLFSGAAFSPDGETLAVTGHLNEFENATQAKIWLFPVSGGEPQILDNWDLSLRDTVGADVRPEGADGVLTWAPDGNMIYALVSERGACSLYAFPVAGARPQLLVGGEREVSTYAFDQNREIVTFVAGDMRTISDIFVMDCRSYQEERLTDVNGQLFQQIDLPQVQELNFNARDGWDLHGWLMKPVGFEPGQKYPLVLQIHGGPHTCYGYAFTQEFQILAAGGYAVLFLNPRGSTSYGQEFVNAVRGNYGDRDFKDLMEAVDEVLKLGWIDEKRIGVSGGSYGGFMTNWIVTQTDRFAAAISHRSISNWVSFNGTPDFGPFFNRKQHLVDDPWSPESISKLWDISPLQFARNVKRPICLMHSEQDYRCPIEQAEQFFMAIKYYAKAPVALVRHPRSNHDLTRTGPPVLRVDRFHKILKWFGQYLSVNP